MWNKRTIGRMVGAAAACLVLAAVSGPAHAISVGWNFDFQGGESLLPADVAGAPGFTQANWNNHASAGQAPGAVPLTLNDDTGSPTTINVVSWTQSANNSWHYEDHSSPDARLLDGFANQEPSLQFDGIGTEFTNNTYSVVVYYGNNEGPDTSNLSITGSIDDDFARSVTTGNTATASFASVGYVEETGANTGPTNFTVFTGLNDPSFTLSLAKAADPNNNNGIAAIQIVSNAAPPPPPTLGDAIGWNFMQSAGEAIAPDEVAGLHPQINWNNDGPNGQAMTGAKSNLTDNEGTARATDVAWSASGNSWVMGSALADGDQKLNNGFLNQQPQVTVSDIPSDFTDAGYSLFVYYNNNEGPGTSEIMIEGTLDDLMNRMVITGPEGATRFDEHGYLIEDGSLSGATNVTVFEGLNDPGFLLSFANVTGSANNGITGFQIVRNALPIPEPTTAALAMLALGGLMVRGRRRNGR
jgi:hypothetical protein